MNIDQLNDGLIKVVEGWNVFGLPALLVFLVIVSLRGFEDTVSAERSRTVGRLGAIHLALAFWALTTIVAELWGRRTMGVFPSNPVTGFFGSCIVLLVNLGLGFCLLKRWRVGRWGAICWSLFRAILAIWLARSTVLPYVPRLDWTEWPRDALYWAFPAFEVLIMFAPGVAKVFRAPTLEALVSERRRPLLSTFALVFLVVALSAALTDAVDWSVRTVGESLLASGVHPG